MTVKEAKKAVYGFIEDTDLTTRDALDFTELVNDLIEAAKEEQKSSYDGELQRLYHLIYNQAVSAAREAFVQGMRPPENSEEAKEEVEEVANV